jgi:hypothetical protein
MNGLIECEQKNCYENSAFQIQRDPKLNHCLRRTQNRVYATANFCVETWGIKSILIPIEKPGESNPGNRT